MTTEPTPWRRFAERGSTAGLLFVAALAVACGRTAAHAFARVLAAYYALFDGAVARVSAAYLRRVGLPAGRRGVFSHCLRFAQVAIDRLFLLRGRLRGLRFHPVGHEHVEALVASGRGALFLGAHLGSFEAMRAHGAAFGLKVSALVDFRNAQAMQRVLRRIAPRAEDDLLPVDAAHGASLLAARERVARGEVLVILADRVMPEEPHVEVSFLGGRARLPAGPFVLAALLRCPVYFVAALFRAPSTYELHCEPLFTEVSLPRGKRDEAIVGYAQRYADTLARYVALAPDNWFNFFDFWIEP